MFITYLQSLLGQLSKGEKGQTAVEYALVLALVALAIVLALALGLNGVLTNVIQSINDQL